MHGAAVLSRGVRMRHASFALGALPLAVISLASSRPVRAQQLAEPAFRTPVMAEVPAGA